MSALTPVAASVSPVKIIEDDSGTCTVAITAGQPVIFDPTAGTLSLGNSSAAPGALVRGIALETGAIGQTITFLIKGIVDLGLDVLTALNFGAPVYLNDTDGMLGTAAGTVSKIVGTVYPGRAGAPYDKLLRIDL